MENMNKYEMAERLQALLEQAETEQEESEMKDIKGYEGKYAITTDGRVWSYRDKVFRLPCDKGTGYLIMGLYNSEQKKVINRPIHQLVAEAFIPKPDWWTPGMKIDVGHKNDKRDDNRVENLYWCTRKENLDTDHYREAAKNRIRSKVRCVETGEIFASQAEAARWVGRNKYGINLVLNGKQQTCGGYHWERVFD